MDDSRKDENCPIFVENNESRTTTDAADNSSNKNIDSVVNKNSGNNNTSSITTLSASALARANSLSLASTSLRNTNHKSPPPHSFNKMKTPTLMNTNTNNNNTTINNNDSAPSNSNNSHNQPKFHPESASSTAANNASRNITIDELRKYFHLPIADVAKKLGTCTTALKKICRKLNITKWPYRQILSLTKSIQSLEMASLSDNLEDAIRQQYQEQIALLHKVIGEVLRNPNKTIEHCSLNDLANAVANANGINTTNNKISSKPAQDSTKEDTELATDTATSPLEMDHKHEPLSNDQDNNNSSNDKQGKSEVKALSLSSSSDTIINIEEEVERTIRRATEFLAAPKVKPVHSQSNNNIANGASKHAAASSQPKRKYSMSFPSAGEVHDPQQPSSSAALSSSPHDTFGKNNNNPNGSNTASQNVRSMAASPASSASSQKARDSSPTEKDTPRHIMNNNNNSSNTGNIQYPNLNIGTSIVKIHYFDHKPNHWAFYGPVQLPPLQRKKFKPLANNALTRRNVPFMEPDVGSNTSIDFVPQTLVNAFKKSFTETKYVGAMANDLMLYDPCTGVFTGRVDPSLMGTGNTNGNGLNPRTQYTLPNRSRVYSMSDAADGTLANTAANKGIPTNGSFQPSLHHMHQVAAAHAHPPMNPTSLPPPAPPGAVRSSSYVHRDSPMSTMHSQDTNKSHSNVTTSGMGMMYPTSTNMSTEERQHFHLQQQQHQQHHYPALHMSYKQQTPAHGLSQTHTSYTTSPDTHLMDTHLHDKGEDHNDDLHSLTPSVLTATIHTAMDDNRHHHHHHHRDNNGRNDHRGQEDETGEGEEEEEDDEHGTALALSALLSPTPLRSHAHHHHHQHLHDVHGYHREPHIFQYADDHLHNQDLIHHHQDDQDNDSGNYLDDAMDDGHRMEHDLQDSHVMKKPRLTSFSAISVDAPNNNNHHVEHNNRNLTSGMATDINQHHALAHDIPHVEDDLQDEEDQDDQDEQREMMRHWMNCDSDVDDEQDDQHIGVASTVQLS